MFDSVNFAVAAVYAAYIVFTVFLFVFMHRRIFALQKIYSETKPRYEDIPARFKKLAAFAKDNKKDFITVCVLFFSGLIVTSLLFGLRKIDSVNGGTDAIQYMLWFDNSKYYGLFEYLKVRNVEPVLVIFLWLFKRMAFSYSAVQIIYYALFFTLTAALLFRMPYNKTFNARYLIMVLLILTSMNLMRNNLACLIGWHIVITVLNKKYLRAVFYSVGAALIHFSALIIIFSVVFLKLADLTEKKFKNIWLFGAAAAGVFVVAYFAVHYAVKILPLGKYSSYAVGSFAAVPTFYKLFVLFFVMLNYRKFTEKSDENRIYFMLLLSSLIIVPLQLNLDICYRMLCYYDLIYVLLTPALLDFYRQDRLLSDAALNCGVYGKLAYDGVYYFTVTAVSYGLYFFAW